MVFHEQLKFAREQLAALCGTPNQHSRTCNMLRNALLLSLYALLHALCTQVPANRNK